MRSKKDNKTMLSAKDESKTDQESRGFYSVLKSENTSWRDKVKLARYGWKYDTVYLPCKEQTLLDWFAGTLAGRLVDRVPVEEAGLLWQSLSDVLKSTKCQRVSPQPLVMRKSVIQMLIDVLLGGGDTAGGCPLDVAISCCYSLCTSPPLQHSILSKFPHLVRLTAGCIQRCTIPTDLSPPLITLTQTLVNGLDSFQRHHLTPIHMAQMFSSHLLRPTLLFCELDSTQLGSYSSDVLSLQTQLQNQVFSSIFDRTLAGKYELYLTDKDGTGKKKDNVFTALHTMLQDEAVLTCVHSALPHLYRAALTSMQKEKPSLWILLLSHLASLLSLPLSSPSPSHASLDLSLHTLASLLAVVQDLGLYQTVDTEEQRDQWFSQLISFLLSINDRGTGWWGDGWTECIRQLFLIDYTLLRKHMAALTAAVATDPCISSGQYRDRLLHSMMDVTDRLRQLPVFTSHLLLTARADDVVWCTALLSRYGSSISHLPPSVVLEILELLLKATSETHKSVGQKTAVSQLLSVVLNNCQLADDNMPARVATKVEAILNEIKTTLLVPVLEGSDSNCKPCHLAVMLELLHNWAQLRMLISHFTFKFDPLTTATTPALSGYDLSPLYPQWVDKSCWDDLYKAANLEDPKCAYTLMKLLLLKVKALLMSPEVTAEVVTSLKNVTEAYMLHREQDYRQETAPWDMEWQSVDGRTYTAASWCLLSDYVPLILPHISSDHLKTLLHGLVKNAAQQPRDTEGSSVTPSMDCSRLLKSSINQEDVHLQSGVLFTTCSLINSLTCPPTTSRNKKRRRSDNDIDVMGPLLQCIETCSGTDIGGTDFMEAVKVSCARLELCMAGCEGRALTNDTLIQVTGLLQVLDCVPLTWLPVEHQITCTLLLLSLLSLIKTRELLRPCYSQLVRLLSAGTDLLILLQHMDVSKLLSFINRLPASTQEDSDLQSCLCGCLVRLGCQSVSSVHQLKTLCTQKDVRMLVAEDKESRKTPLILSMIKVSAQELCRNDLTTELRSALCALHALLLPLFPALMPSQPHKEAVIEAFSAELERVWRGVKKSERSMLEHIPEMFTLCCRAVETAQVYVGSCVHLIQTLCHGVRLQPSLISPHLPPHTLSTCWNLLTSLIHVTHTPSTSSAFPLDSDLVRDVRGILGEESKVVDGGATMERTDGGSAVKGSDGGAKFEGSDGATVDRIDGGAKVKSTDGGEMVEGIDGGAVDQVQVEGALATVFSVCDEEERDLITQSLLKHVTPDQARLSPHQTLRALTAWKQLLHTNHNTELQHVSKQMVVHIEVMVHQTRDMALKEAGLLTLAAMLAHSKALLSPVSAVSCLAPCSSVSLNRTDLSLCLFVRLFTAVQDVVFQLLTRHTEAALHSVPALMAVIKLLVVSLVWQGRQREPAISEEEQTGVLNCAHLLHRLCQQVATHKVEFARIAPYLIPEYTHKVQEVTLIPKVKRELVVCMTCLLDISDQRSINHLQMVLPEGQSQIFRNLYSEFTSYHKYTGRV